MNGQSFKLTVVTPTEILERKIIYIRLQDCSGFFGIMKGHINFLTTLVPSLCYYRDEKEKECFLAIDGGILQVREGLVTLTSREVFESSDPEKLVKIIDGTMLKRAKSEADFQKLLEGIENSFLQKSIDMEREKS